MPEPTEAELLKRAFQAVDRQGTGRFSRNDLARVFRELEDWSQEDLTEMFDAVDSRKDGTIEYAALIDWIMQGDDGAAGDVDEVGLDEDSDDDEAEEAAMFGVCRELDLDLHRKVSKDEFVKIMGFLHLATCEAQAIYEDVEKDVQRNGGNFKSGIELLEFLDDLDVQPGDFDGLKMLDDAVDAVQHGREPPAKSLSEERVLDHAAAKVAFALRKANKPVEDTWDFLHRQGVGLSMSERKAVATRQVGDLRSDFVQLVKQMTVSPPVLPASAGQISNREECTAKVNAIIAKCRETSTKFVDPEWDLEANPNNALYVDKKGPGFDCTVARPSGYKRLSELVQDPKLFKGGIEAGDIKQGQIGTCFLLGALGAIAASKDEAISKAFIHYDMQLGVYGIRFCVDGDWTHVIIDDMMPVDAHGRLLYARSPDPQEVWAPLLEKAYCKLNTCYEMCDGGKATQAIYHLCGGASGKFAISDKHKKDPKTYFDVLKSARATGFVLTTTFVIRKSEAKSTGKCGEAVLPTGLVGGHVYSVIKLVEVAGVRLVQCRNPWGTGEWKGKYSDANAQGEWTKEIATACEWSGKNDGKFWMCIEDFVQNSAGVDYARTFGPQWRKVTACKKFQIGTLKAKGNWGYKSKSKDEVSFNKGDTLEVITVNPGWWFGNVLGAPDVKGFFPGNYVKLLDRPVARFDLLPKPEDPSQPMSAVIILMQPNTRMKRKFYTRKKDGKTYKDITYGGMELIIKNPEGKVVFKSAGKKRSISHDIVLPAGSGGGTWKIYALSLDGRGSEFTLRTYIKGGAVSLTEVENASLSEVSSVITG